MQINNIDHESSVARMVERSGLTEQTNKRRFARATVLSPKEYIHTVRLEEAKQMLEGSALPVEAIANEIGYEDASFSDACFVARLV